MISAIREFCAENNVNVDMRIGIHTGIVICGIVGVKRFKVGKFLYSTCDSVFTSWSFGLDVFGLVLLQVLV